MLDTDGVNAYAAPGGLVHITRGLLGLMKYEAELAGVLGHEITHVTAKHTVRAIQKSKCGRSWAPSGRQGRSLAQRGGQQARRARLTTICSEQVRSERREWRPTVSASRSQAKSDTPRARSADVLKALDARNTGRSEPNGMFASHPATKDASRSIEKTIKEQKLAGTAIVAARYKENITWDAKPAAEITT